MKNTTLSPSRWFCLGLASAAALCGQVAPDASVQAANEDVVTLSEFNVTTSANSEYVAAESITGTRVASKIQDLPFTVNVVTSEFIDDFNALEFGEQFAYTSSVVAYETISTGYSVRGFEADVQLRNGFRRIGLIDKVSVDRAEVIKGPSASIYGTTLPGGIVNVITKKPKTKPEYRFNIAAGTNDYFRAQASATGPVGDSQKLYYRVDLAADKREYDMPFKNKEQATGSVQLLWKPSSSSSLHVEFERLVRNEEGNANVPFAIQNGYVDPYRVNVNTGAHPTINRYVRVAKELMEFNVQGPLNYSKRYVNTGTVTFEHRFSDRLSFRSSANIYDRNLIRQEIAGRDQYNPVTNAISSATSATGNSSSSWLPRYRPYGEHGGGWQNDFLFSFDTGAVGHKLLVTLDYQRQAETPSQFLAPASAMPADVLTKGLQVANPDYNYVTYDQDPSVYTTVNQDDNNSLDVYGLFISERATLMDGRLILLAGGRYDYVDNHAIRYRPNPTESENQSDDFTYQAGVNFKLTPGITAYGNSSTSFVPQYGNGRNLDGTTFPVPNETGEGWEVGVKATLLENRLTFTAGYFDIVREGILRATTDETGIIYDTISGQEGATGYELDFNWAINPALQVFGGYGFTDSEVISNTAAPHLIGSSTRRTPEHTLGLGMKYQFKSGTLRGLSFTAGYKYNSESLINPSSGRAITITGTSTGFSSTGIVNARMPNGLLLFPERPEGEIVRAGPGERITVRVDDGRESIFNDPFHVVDVGASYSWRTGDRYRHKLQLNLTNVLDEVYTFGSAGQGQRVGGSLTYDLQF
jgi:outer membrane receptor protein involved in Fe transport